MILNIGDDLRRRIRREIYLDCNEAYGKNNALEKLQEECVELAAAIIHYNDGRASQMDVITEVVDVLITCEKYVELSGCEGGLRSEFAFKIQRLRQRLNSKKGEGS